MGAAHIGEKRVGFTICVCCAKMAVIIAMFGAAFNRNAPLASPGLRPGGRGRRDAARSMIAHARRAIFATYRAVRALRA